MEIFLLLLAAQESQQVYQLIGHFLEIVIELICSAIERHRIIDLIHVVNQSFRFCQHILTGQR